VAHDVSKLQSNFKSKQLTLHLADKVQMIQTVQVEHWSFPLLLLLR